MKSRKKPLEENRKFYEALAKRLKELRKDAGYDSYEYFAYETGLSRAQYGKYESGTSDMYLSTLLAIAHQHNLSIDQLLIGLDQYKKDEK